MAKEKSSTKQDYGTGRLKLGFSKSLDIVLPYVGRKFVEQIRTVWFIIAYLIIFQVLVLKLPIVFSLMIGIGVLFVILGLTFFMEGLDVGLMPFGEIIGSVLPKKSNLPVILLFAVLLGIGATFAEPAIAVLKAAGAGVKPQDAPLLFSLLNDFSGQLVAVVGLGVGVAVLLGILRFLYGWSLKTLILPLICTLGGITIWAHFDDTLIQIAGLAWDCGAVTTGPVTVPLVLALGIGVCRIVRTGNSEGSGFGIVTLASLFPIVAVFLLGMFHIHQDDFYGQPNYKGITRVQVEMVSEKGSKAQAFPKQKGFSKGEFKRFVKTEKLDSSDYEVQFVGGRKQLKDGKIIQRGANLVYTKTEKSLIRQDSVKYWDPRTNVWLQILEAVITAIQAILPLSLFLFFTLRFVLKEKIAKMDEIILGIIFAVIGMAIFVLGISLGLTPLGGQLGGNIPGAFTSIVPWGLDGFKSAIFEGATGKILAATFAFFLGYGATLAEPALNALGATVEKLTTGAFKKSLLMHTVATGVGTGIAMGVIKISYNLPLEYFLLPPYLLLIFLTIFSSEQFVNFGWDSAGVTTGPITVPLVLAMGLGIGANVPGVTDGFGVLSLASVGPIISVLTVGLIVSKTSNRKRVKAKK